MTTLETIRKPAAWENSTFDDLMECEAGRDYVLSQLDPKSTAITPDHSFQSSQPNADACWYKIYSDGSLWFVNNAEDEVWSDYTDFIRDNLLPGIEAQGSPPGMCWNQEEVIASTDHQAWSVDAMDRNILTLYSGDDEAAARELIGL